MDVKETWVPCEMGCGRGTTAAGAKSYLCSPCSSVVAKAAREEEFRRVAAKRKEAARLGIECALREVYGSPPPSSTPLDERAQSLAITFGDDLAPGLPSGPLRLARAVRVRKAEESTSGGIVEEGGKT